MLSSSTKKWEIIEKWTSTYISLDFGVWWSIWPFELIVFASVFLCSPNRMKSGLGLKWSSDSDDQHLKQDIRAHIEDLQGMQEVQYKNMEESCTRTREESDLNRCYIATSNISSVVVGRALDVLLCMYPWNATIEIKDMSGVVPNGPPMPRCV